MTWRGPCRLASWPRAACLALLCASAAPAQAQAPPRPVPDLEALMRVQVTSASRREERLAEAAAAVFVLTRDDIRRSGLTTVPDLLRLVPGVQVAQIDGNKWAISVRGFNSRWANKLLVMINGRSIYSSIFSGVMWDALDVPVEHIERIEVVRGPGGSLWGANAMNGVINIITRVPAQREGTARASVSSRGDLIGHARYAAPLGQHANFVVYGGGTQMEPTRAATHDRWTTGRVGAELEWRFTDRDRLALETAAMDSHAWSNADTIVSPVPLVVDRRPSLIDTESRFGALRWRHANGGGELQALGAFSTVGRREFDAWNRSRVIEAGVQHTAPTRRGHELTSGVSVLHNDQRVDGNPNVALSVGPQGKTVTSAFLQDEIEMVPGRLAVTVGTKIEYFSDTGWALQPTARVRWNISERQTVWGAVSRAVRTPSLVERAIVLNLAQDLTFGFPVISQVQGNRELGNERLVAYEAGYRWTAPAVSFDAAAYINSYDRLTNLDRGTPYLETAGGLPFMLLPLKYINGREATAGGGEVLLTVSPTAWCRAIASYSLFAVRADLSATDIDETLDGEAPRHQASVRSLFTLPKGLEADVTIGYTGALRTPDVQAYTRLDARVGWRVHRQLEVSAVAENLFDAEHFEFDGLVARVAAAPVRRRASVSLRWRF